MKYGVILSLLSLVGNNAASGEACACDKSCPPGTNARLRIVPACEIDDFPDTLADPNVDQLPGDTPGDIVTLDGDIVLDATVPGQGYWREFDIIIGSGQVTDTLVGSDGSWSWDSDILFRLACVDRDQAAFAKCMANGCYVFAIQPKGSDFWRVVGNPDNAAKAQSIVLDTGSTSDSVNQGTYVARANTECPALYYDGVFDLTPNP